MSASLAIVVAGIIGFSIIIAAAAIGSAIGDGNVAAKAVESIARQPEARPNIMVFLFLGVGVTMLIVRKWRLRTVPLPPAPTTPGAEAVRRRIRNETQL